MNNGTSPKQPHGLDEPLDIDEETLDSALMDLLTSDWQALEGDGDSKSEGADDEQLPPSESPAQ